MPYLTNISALYGLDECLDEFNVALAPLLAECEIDSEQFKRMEGKISYGQVAQILELAARQSRCPHFGLLMSRRQSIHILGLVGITAEKCENLRAAFQDNIKYFHIHSRGAAVHLEEIRNIAVLEYQVLAPSTSTKQIIDLSVGTMINVARCLIHPDWQPLSIYLAHDKPDNVAIYHKILGAQVTFNHNTNTVVFDRSVLDTPLRGNDKANHDLLVRIVRQLDQKQPVETIDKTTRAIRQLLPDGKCSLAAAAKQLHISPRTLQYHLAEHGVGFRELVDQVRMAIAQQYLAQTNTPLLSLCCELGYADQASFCRAFKRWFGTSPKQWASMHRTG